MKTLAAVLLAAALPLGAASAQEAIRTGPEGSGAPPTAQAPAAARADPAADPETTPAANGAWARDVLAGQPAASDGKTAKPGHCQAPPDRKPHGEVWAGAGTGGYREVGGVVTQPIGDCASVTIAVDKTEFDGRRRGRR